MKKMFIPAVLLTMASPQLLANEEPQLASLDVEEVTITATRVERSTKDVPEAISVIGEERIDNARMFNIADALSGTPGVSISSKNGGYDTRLLIRGGGLKANYGIREIFLMRDGVPITDPDSFTRLDFIDTQDIKRIEVSKGPGNIYASGSTAGVIHLISKSVFDESVNKITVAAGDEGKQNLHVRYGETHGQHAYAITASHRQADNDWRRFNEFESSQIGIKYGFQPNDTDELTVELSYTESDLDLPGDMTQEQFEEFEDSREQEDNNSFFKTNGRYSKTWFLNSQYVAQLQDNLQFKPRVYYTHWEQYHPVTRFINDNDGVDVMGSDLEFVWDQQIGSLVTGLTLRLDKDDDAKKYEYKDFEKYQTLSQEKGGLAQVQDTESTVIGIFAQQSIDYFDQWIIDLSLRYDSISIEQEIHELSEMDWGYTSSQYTATLYNEVDNRYSLDETFSLLALRAGVSFEINDALSVYTNIATGEQVPFSSELESNPDLKAAQTDSYEIGLKGRGETWAVDVALFNMEIEDEVVAGIDANNLTYFQNAGEVEKRGLELTSKVLMATITEGELWGGLNYTYSDFEFNKFSEYYTQYGGGPPQLITLVNDGNQLPFVPEHYYSLYMLYEHPTGVSVRLQSDNWGSYYIDNANTEKYEGYDWVTSLNVKYSFLEHHSVSLNIQNITDEYYASIVKKNAGKDVGYTPGAPRSFLVSYSYYF